MRTCHCPLLLLPPRRPSKWAREAGVRTATLGRSPLAPRPTSVVRGALVSLGLRPGAMGDRGCRLLEA